MQQELETDAEPTVSISSKRALDVIFYEDRELFQKEDREKGMIISLPAALASDLDWTEQIELAEQVVQSKGWILWELDFSLATHPVSFADTMSFSGFCIAIEQFTKAVYAAFAESSYGVIVYKGDLQIASRFIWEESLERNFSEWLAQNPHENSVDHGTQELKKEGEGLLVSSFCMTVFAEYLHRLISYLPEDLPVFCKFDLAKESSLAKLSYLLSKERFSQIQFIVKGNIFPFSHFVWQENTVAPLLDRPSVSTGVCIPHEEILSTKLIEDLDHVFSFLSKRKIAFRIVHEAFLNQEWDQLEEIVAVSSFLSTQGKRKLQGFCAAGGRVVSYGENIGFFEEISLEEYKKSE